MLGYRPILPSHADGYPQNAHIPEKIFEIPGIMPELSICLLCLK